MSKVSIISAIIGLSYHVQRAETPEHSTSRGKDTGEVPQCDASAANDNDLESQTKKSRVTDVKINC